MTPEIVYKDEHLIAINKPAGWIVNKSKTTGNNPVIQEWLEKEMPELHFENPQNDFESRAGIVHRLDKPTSGVLLVGRTNESFLALQKQFKDRTTQKEYLALVHGFLGEVKGNIKAPVGRLPWNRERFGVLSGGRDAETDYSLVNNYILEKEKFSLVSFKPKTGRTHQIRIHAKYIHHPIVSDTFYAGRKTARKDLKWCPRLFLHAHKISIFHPKSEERMTLEAPLPEDLQKVLSRLEKKNSSQ